MMVDQKLFPQDLLGQPPNQRLAYFRSLTIAHPSLCEAYEELQWTIRDSASGSLIFVQGPAGVGKTTLLRRVEQSLVQELLPELDDDTERVPVVRLTAVASEANGFNWKDYFRRLLFALAEPMVDHKSRLIRSSEERNNDTKLALDPHATSARLRYITEQALGHRRPVAVLVDDAQHLAMISSGRKLLDQLNTIKSIADLTHTTHVLVGTYELTSFRNLSGQLSRRSTDIQLMRYRVENREERQAFINVLWTFQQHLPLVETPDLICDWDYFYERSIGCVGILKDWLTRALAVALRKGEETLKRRELNARALSVAQCAKLLAESVEGERKLAETEESCRTLRRNLGLDTNGSCTKDTVPLRFDSEPISKPHKQKRNRVGRRNPVRDPIGAVNR